MVSRPMNPSGTHKRKYVMLELVKWDQIKQEELLSIVVWTQGFSPSLSLLLYYMFLALKTSWNQMTCYCCDFVPSWFYFHVLMHFGVFFPFCQYTCVQWMSLVHVVFLAHLSRRLEWAIAVRFRPSSVVRRASCVVRRASSVVRRPSSVNFLHFHLLLENAWLDFNQTWQESSLGVGDSKLFK